MNMDTKLAGKPLLLVASAALIDADGRLLLTQRPDGKAYAGWWELPGGKLEPGERPEQALSREIAEELDVTVAPADWQPLTFVTHDYADMPWQALVLIHIARVWQGTPQGLEAQAFAWVLPDNLDEYQLLPTMQAALPAIRACLRQA